MLKKLYLYVLLILSCVNAAISDINAATFQNITNKNFSCIYVPGMISLATQAGKYIPEFVATSGETVLCKNGIHTLHQPLSTCTFSEVGTRSLSNQSLNPFVYLGYWITGRLNQKYGVSVQRNQSSQTGYTLDGHSFDLTKLCLGQEADIEALLKTYNEHVEKYPDTHIILYGASRGAATICNFIAKHQPQNIAALVLEAPFDSIPHLLKHSYKMTHKFIHNVLPKVSHYDPNGASPLNSIEHISKDIPVLIISSKLDDVIPVECAKSLKRKFSKLGHNKSHLLILNKATHSGYAYDDQADRTKYESVVHAFYKHYGLPHDENLASLGADEWKKISGQTAMMPPVS